MTGRSLRNSLLRWPISPRGILRAFGTEPAANCSGARTSTTCAWRELIIWVAARVVMRSPPVPSRSSGHKSNPPLTQAIAISSQLSSTNCACRVRSKVACNYRMRSMSTHRLVLLRHGQSQWNLENRFTGWADVDLSEQGEREARAAVGLLREHGFTFDIAYTSVLRRAI